MFIKLFFSCIINREWIWCFLWFVVHLFPSVFVVFDGLLMYFFFFTLSCLWKKKERFLFFFENYIISDGLLSLEQIRLTGGEEGSDLLL